MKPALCLLFVLMATNTYTQQQTVHIGAGAQSCGEWLSAVTASPQTEVQRLKDNMMLSWVQGYVVGAADAMTMLISKDPALKLSESQARYGTVSGWVFDPPDAEAMKHWITKYCREQPLERLTAAGLALVSELFTKK